MRLFVIPQAVLLCFSLMVFETAKAFSPAQDLSEAVVKITSSFSSSTIPPRQGSGILIRFRKKIFILTSDHVVYHSNRSFKHQMLTFNGDSLALQYLISDAGHGLALLNPETESADFSKAVDLDSSPSWRDSKLNTAEQISLAGFPVSSDAVLVDSSAKIKSLQTPSELFVQLPTLLEVSSGHGEFGMSGGLGYSQTGIFRGVISHQVVNDQENTVLLIGAPEVRAWLQSVVATDGTLFRPSPVALAQDPAQQASEFPSLRSANFYITLIRPFAGVGPTGIEVLLTKTPSTETLFGGSNGRLSEILAVKSVCDCHFRSLGFRKKTLLGSSEGGGATLPQQMRRLLDSSIEPLWTFECR
jgi:hypothetical protein